MPCCNTPPAGANRFFSWFARRSRRHYQKKGLGKAQRQLVEGISAQQVDGASVLEIGCGVGYLHQTLLIDGAASAMGVDLSEGMLNEARELAKQRQVDSRTEYRQGDFIEIADELPNADVTVLDKVVCCYQDAKTLVHRSLEKTERVYALTYPRAHFVNRILTAVEATALWLIRCDFRPYVHDPADVERWIVERGFHKKHERLTWIWLTQVYAR
ncbi:MAG TPA: class I SAM-dependent methyltransferase [Gammaproteobacteria bacterium]